MKRFTRRALLTGAGLGAGAALLAPFLSRIARADALNPKRFVFVVEGNCFEPITLLSDAARAAINQTVTTPIAPDARWWFPAYAHNTPLDVPNNVFAGAPALASLAMAPTIAAQTAVLFGMSSKIVGGGHSAEHGVLSSSRTVSGIPGGPTIDAYLGGLMAVRDQAPYDVIRLGVSPDINRPLDFSTCAYGPRHAAPMLLQPKTAYNALFGVVASADGMAAFARSGDLLDFARDDVNASIAAFPGNSQERAKLESYLASLEEVRARHDGIVALQSRLAAVRPTPPDMNPLYAMNDPLDRFRAQLELATAALKGGLTNVAVIGCGTGGDFDVSYPTVIPGVSRHPLHHGSATNPTYLAAIHTVTKLQVDAVVRMAQALAATPEATASGSMLDHTLIVYIGDNGEQHHSTASEFPVLLIGGSALGLRTGGRTVVYPGIGSTGHRQVSNLWNTLGHVAGEDLNLFGTEARTRVAPGPLSELYG